MTSGVQLRATEVRRRDPRARGSLSARILGALGELLLTAGVLVLLFAAWQVWWTDLTANAVHADSVTRLEQQFTEPAPAAIPAPTPKATPIAPAPVVLAAAPVPPVASEGAAFAIARIPRLGSGYAVPIVEGTSRAVLERGIGHYAGTAQPGRIGNLALAGHRMTYGGPFRDIERVRPGDVVVVETATTFYVYTMGPHSIVDPDHIEAIAPVPERPGETPTVASITLTACHPKYASTWRWIVHGELSETIPRASWKPAQYGLTGGT